VALDFQTTVFECEFIPLPPLKLTSTNRNKSSERRTKTEFRVFLMTRSVVANNENTNKSEDNRNQQINLFSVKETLENKLRNANL
jgi:hypothetical protein